MAQIQGKLVGYYWYVILRAAEDAGVKFQLNSGRRTMAQQRVLVAQKGVWSPRNPTGAAYPNPSAPHIRENREDHALDVDTARGSNANLTRWLVSEGVAVRHPIAAEPWHIEVSIAHLEKLYLRYRRTHGFPNPARRWIREYDRSLRASKTKGRKRRSVLRKAMKAERKKYFGKKQFARLYTALLIRSR